MHHLPECLNTDKDVKVVLPDGSSSPLAEFLLPSFTLMLGAMLLIISMFVPYWKMTLYAPQYPQGLSVSVYINRLDGDVNEIDELNHYLGMPVLNEGGKLERALSVYMIVCLGLLLMAGVFVHNHWAAIFALPSLGFPFVFLLDLKYILYRYGHSIDPTSALGGAIKPFTPPLFGKGAIGQFSSYSSPQLGLVLSFAALCVVLIGLWFHRLAYKPVVEARAKMLDKNEVHESVSKPHTQNV